MGIAFDETVSKEIEEMQKAEQEAFYEEISRPLNDMEKLQLLVSSIPTLPQPRSNRVGFLWKPMYDSEQNVFGWEEIPDPYYKKNEDGTYLDPILFEEGMYVITDLWYTDGEDIWECIKEGYPRYFADKEFFDVIGV